MSSTGFWLVHCSDRSFQSWINAALPKNFTCVGQPVNLCSRGGPRFIITFITFQLCVCLAAGLLPHVHVCVCSWPSIWLKHHDRYALVGRVRDEVCDPRHWTERDVVNWMAHLTLWASYLLKLYVVNCSQAISKMQWLTLESHLIPKTSSLHCGS